MGIPSLFASLDVHGGRLESKNHISPYNLGADLVSGKPRSSGLSRAVSLITNKTYDSAYQPRAEYPSEF